jgi:hypothetical protein
MSAAARDSHDTDAVDVPDQLLTAEEVRDEESHWLGAYRHEHYFRPGLEYEDYAPAYCVGYIGFAQYGGRFEDAERSLCANWERIKGDSRLPYEDALAAMRAAWNRTAARIAEPA